jgi:hypothetical protein
MMSAHAAARAVNDQARSISDTATITATSPIKIRLPGVPINHIVAFRLSALLTKRPARLADLGSDLDQAIVALRRTAIRAHRAQPLCARWYVI